MRESPTKTRRAKRHFGEGVLKEVRLPHIVSGWSKRECFRQKLRLKTSFLKDSRGNFKKRGQNTTGRLLGEGGKRSRRGERVDRGKKDKKLRPLRTSREEVTNVGYFRGECLKEC